MFPTKYLKPLLSLCSLPSHVDKKEGNSEGNWLYKKINIASFLIQRHFKWGNIKYNFADFVSKGGTPPPL